MSNRPHRVAQLVALSMASLALVVGSLLSAAPALAQVLPPEPAGHDTTNSTGSSGTAWWTFVLIACAVTLIVAALGYGLLRFQHSRTSQQRGVETTDQQRVNVTA